MQFLPKIVDCLGATSVVVAVRECYDQVFKTSGEHGPRGRPQGHEAVSVVRIVNW